MVKNFKQISVLSQLCRILKYQVPSIFTYHIGNEMRNLYAFIPFETSSYKFLGSNLWSVCLSLLHALITGVCHHTHLFFYVFVNPIKKKNKFLQVAILIPWSRSLCLLYIYICLYLYFISFWIYIYFYLL
jgi:hypothetical protein